MSTAGFSAFLARKNIKPSAKLYFVDAMSAMAMGLFASLLIGTILDTLGDQFHWDWLVTTAGYASSATGIAIAVAIGVSLSAPPLVLYSLCAVGLGSYSVGGPLGAFFAVIVAAELGKAVSRETKVDILVTPTVTILSGLGIGTLIGPGVSLLMNGFGQLIIRATQLRPFLMGIIVSVLVGIVLTLPISSAAICFTLTLTGLAGGAATAGCCAQMIGFAVMSFAENGWGGLVAQGLGTSMLQMGNIAFIQRSGCSQEEMSFGTLEQSRLCIETPCPLVIKPIISSPGRGSQQRASFIRQLSTPSTTTPSVDLTSLGETVDMVSLVTSGAGL